MEMFCLQAAFICRRAGSDTLEDPEAMFAAKRVLASCLQGDAGCSWIRHGSQSFVVKGNLFCALQVLATFDQ